MNVKVGYNEAGEPIQRQTHHISLSDGIDTVGIIVCDNKGDSSPKAISRSPMPRTALKTVTGDVTYSDFEQPWSPQSQSSFVGRGLEDFDDDVTRFFDCRRIDLVANNVIPAPLETYNDGICDGDHNLPGDYSDGGVSWNTMIAGEKKYLAYKFSASTSYTAKYIYLYVKRVGTPASDLTVALCSDNSGDPGTVLQSNTVSTDDITDVESELYRVTITEQSLTGSTSYWIKVYPGDADEKNHWKVGIRASSGTTKKSADGSSWSTASIDLYCYITEAQTTSKPMFFQYKRSKYLLLNASTGAPTLYINGARGFATSNSGNLDKLIAGGSPGWTTDCFVGAVVLIIGGLGYAEEKRWRVITANDTYRLTVDENWTITQDTTTEFVILGSTLWTTVTGHGLTAPVKDVCVVNNIAYFCEGESVNLRRMKYDSSGYTWADDGTNKASFMVTVFDATNGLTIWRANNGTPPSVSSASVANWGTNLSFGTAKEFKDDFGYITGLEEYGTENTLWIMREGIVFYLYSGNPVQIPLKEMSTIMEDTNGQAHCVQNVYLYFNLGAGIERYYGANLDDIGMDRDAGLPEDRQGVVSCILGYPGKIMASVDGGSDNISTVYFGSSSSWWEIYRAPAAGERILDMCYQTVPGTTTDKLMIFVGGNVVSLCFPSYVSDPTKDENMRFVHECSITSGYVYANLFDIEKLFHAVKVFAENLEKDNVEIGVDIKADTDENWTTIDDLINISPMDEVILGTFAEEAQIENMGINGKRLRWRLRLMTNDSSIPPILKTVVTELLVRVPVKYSFSLKYRARDGDVDLNNDLDEFKYAIDKIAKLEEWATSITPLTMRCMYKAYDNKRVIIDPQPNAPSEEHGDSFINQLTLIEV